MRALLKDKYFLAWSERVICIILGSFMIIYMSRESPDQMGELIKLAGALLVYRGIK